MKANIKIVDSVMGSGKTCAMINYMNSHPEQRYFFITPYLNETERIKEACPTLGFQSPKVEKEKSKTVMTKMSSLTTLVAKGCNIVTTHALFQDMYDKLLDTIKEKHYTLVMDEVLEILLPLKISGDDLDILLPDIAHIGDDGLVVWNRKDYKGNYSYVKYMCDAHELRGAITPSGKPIIIRTIPEKFYNVFDNIYILTYLFESSIQRYFFDLIGNAYTYMHPEMKNDSFVLVEGKKTSHPDYSDLIDIYEGNLNNIGKEPHTLSKGWYEENDDKLSELKNNTYNFFINIMRGISKSKTNMWTTFKEYRKDISNKGYVKGFVPCNTRATNVYSHKTAIAYLINKYPNPFITTFFSSYGINVNREALALSEMIQFIWRSAIRNGEKIYLYIPSERMRNLFIKWLDDTEDLNTGKECELAS